MREVSDATVHTDQVRNDVFFLLLERDVYVFLVTHLDTVVVGIGVNRLVLFIILLSDDYFGRFRHYTFLHHFLNILIVSAYVMQRCSSVFVDIVYLSLNIRESFRMMFDARSSSIKHFTDFFQLVTGHHVFHIIELIHHIVHLLISFTDAFHQLFLWILVVLRLFIRLHLLGRLGCLAWDS